VPRHGGQTAPLGKLTQYPQEGSCPCLTPFKAGLEVYQFHGLPLAFRKGDNQHQPVSQNTDEDEERKPLESLLRLLFH
jgi:hypothetical protein